MDLNRLNTKRILSMVALITVMILAIVHVMDILQWAKTAVALLTPFFLGGAIAFIVNVPMRFLEEKLFVKIEYPWFKKSERTIALLLSLTIIFALFSLVAVVVVPQLIDALTLFVSSLPKYAEQLNMVISKLPDPDGKLQGLVHAIDSASPSEIQRKILDFFNIKNVTQALSETLTATLSTTFGVVTSIFAKVINFVLAACFALYALAKKEDLARQVRKIIYAFFGKRQAAYVVHLGQVAYAKFFNFITGQFTEAVILGVLCFIGMHIFRFPYAGMISVLVGFCNMIPIAGAFIGGSVGFLLILSMDPMKALLFLVFLVVLQQFEGNIIYPRVVGGSVGLPAIWTLVAITLGGTLLGLIGMLTFVPLCATLYTITTEIVNARLEMKDITADSAELKTGLPAGVPPYKGKSRRK